MREGVLQARGRSQRTRPEWRYDVVYQHAFALDATCALARAANPAGEIGWHAVAVVVECGGRRRGRAGIKRFGLKAREKSGDDVAGGAGSRTIAEGWRPRFVLPRDDVSLRIDTRALIHQECVPVVLPRHLVLAGELHADRFAHGL